MVGEVGEKTPLRVGGEGGGGEGGGLTSLLVSILVFGIWYLCLL